MLIIILSEIKMIKKTWFRHFSANQNFAPCSINTQLSPVSISWLSPPIEKKLCGFFGKKHQNYDLKKIKRVFQPAKFLQHTIHTTSVVMCEYRAKNSIRKKVFFSIFQCTIFIINALSHDNFPQILQDKNKKKIYISSSKSIEKNRILKSCLI